MVYNKIVCTYCKQPIDTDVVIIIHNEDGEPCHNGCLDKFNEHWIVRDEFMDLLGY